MSWKPQSNWLSLLLMGGGLSSSLCIHYLRVEDTLVKSYLYSIPQTKREGPFLYSLLLHDGEWGISKWWTLSGGYSCSPSGGKLTTRNKAHCGQWRQSKILRVHTWNWRPIGWRQLVSGIGGGGGVAVGKVKIHYLPGLPDRVTRTTSQIYLQLHFLFLTPKINQLSILVHFFFGFSPHLQD